MRILSKLLFIVLLNYTTSHAASLEVDGEVSSKSRVCSCGDHDCAVARGDIPRGRGASGRWIDDITPKRNWVAVDIIDEGSRSLTCEMCLRETIRYVHKMEHYGFPDLLKVGCICAAYMEGILDKSAAKKRKRHVISRMTWLSKFLNDDDSSWKVGRSGKPYFKTAKRSAAGEVLMMINKSLYGQYGGSYMNGSRWVNAGGWHATPEEAKRALFDIAFPRMPLI